MEHKQQHWYTAAEAIRMIRAFGSEQIGERRQYARSYDDFRDDLRPDVQRTIEIFDRLIAEREEGQR